MSYTDEQRRFLKALGGRLRQLRKTLGITQERLALEAGLKPSYVSDVEHGRRNISIINLGMICQVLGMTLAELLTDVPNPGQEAEASS